MNKNYKIVSEFNEGIAVARKENNWGYVNLSGDLIVPIKYRYAKPFQHGIGILETLNDPAREGAIDRTGKVVIPFIYGALNIYSEKYISALAPRIGDKNCWGLIDYKGNVIIPFEFASISEIKDGYYKGCFWVSKSEFGEWYTGVISNSGKLIYPFLITLMEYTSNGGLPILYKDLDKYSNTELEEMGIYRLEESIWKRIKRWFSKF